MNQQEIQGVARQIERLTKRVIRAELGNQLEREALVEIAKLLELEWPLSCIEVVK